jgi:GT2 family glycosyltransferase
MNKLNHQKRLVSVIIPVYGRCSLLPSLIRQLKTEIRDNQDLKYEMHLHIVDNGTKENLQGLNDDKTITISKPGSNLYYFGAVKHAIQATTCGDIIVVMNQDICLSSKSFIIKLVQSLLESPAKTAAVCPVITLLALPNRINCLGLSQMGANL